MSQLERLIDSELGVTDINTIGQWDAVESFVNKELGITPDPEPTFEEKEKHIRDVFDVSDELELPYKQVLDEYDEIQRQKKEFPFGKIQPGRSEFSARKLFRNLYDKVKPPPLGDASPGQIFNKLLDGTKAVGHIGAEWVIGKKTLGLADIVAAPAEAFHDVFLANRELKKSLESEGLTVTDVGTKYEPTWKITDPEGDVKFITPNTVADKEFASSVAELYDRIVGFEAPSHLKKWGEIAKVIGTFQAAAKIRGKMPAHIGTIGKAGQAAQVGLIYGTATELRKGLVGDETYRGTIGVMEDAVVLAGLSLIGSGIGGVWEKLKPTEQRKALKLLGLKEKDLVGLTETQIADKIRKAARPLELKYHQDKVGVVTEEWHRVMQAKDVLMNRNYGKDIIYRGSAPSAAKLLTGVTEEGVPIKPAKPPITVEPAPITPIKAVVPPVKPLKPKISPTVPSEAALEQEKIKAIRRGLDELLPPKAIQAVTEGKKTRATLKKEVTQDIIQNDPIYASEIEAIVEQRDLGTGTIYIQEKFRGEAKLAIGNYPKLKFQITYDPEKGKHWDELAMELGMGDASVDEILELKGQAATSRKMAGEIPQSILDKMHTSNNPYSEIAALKHEMVHQGYGIDEINENILEIAVEYDISTEGLLLEVEADVQAKQGISKKVAGKKGATQERQKDLFGREGLIGGAAGEQQEFLDKEKFRLAEPDIEGQMVIEKPPPQEPLTDKQMDKHIDGMRPGFVDIEPYVESLKSAHDWMFTFGEAKRLNSELFDKLMKSYGERNAAVEKAIAILKRTTVANLTADEAMELAIVYEDKRLIPPEGLEETYEGYANLLDKIEQRSLKDGIFQQTFQERMIAENEAKIAELRETKPKSKKISELVAENEQLRQMRYLPHSVVAQRTIEAKLAELQGEERKTYLDSIARISAKYKKRTGKLFMKDYLDEGILKPGDIDIRRLTANALTEYYYRSALKNLFDYSIEQELVKSTSDSLRKEGWQNQQEIGIISPELKGKLVHPLLASSLSEMKEMKLGKGGGTIRQLLSMVKIGQFIKPSIIWTYNAIQAFMKGMYQLDPIKGQRLLAESYRSVVGKNALYHKLNESNLYQFPYEVSRNSIEEQIDQYIRQNSPEISRLTKLLEKTTDMTWRAEDLDIKKMIMVGHRALANLTWTGDKIQRTHSYLILTEMGYPHEEAVKVAANSHGAYSALSEKYKKTLSPLTFVYSFRVLMPIEIAKILTEPLIGIPQAFYKKEPIPKYKWNRWVKSWVGAVAIPVLTDMYMKERGFEKEGKHLGPLAWKWKKTVDGKEIVVGVNNILNMPVKYWNRITYYNPIRPEARWQQAMNNLIKWEIHPLWRIMFWDIYANRKSFGSGVNVYDPNDPPLQQLGQALLYTFGQSFRFWGGMMDAVGEGSVTDKERKAQEAVFDEGLNRLDKFLFTVFGYKYVRAPLKERKAIAMASLQKEMTRRVLQIGKKYEGKELETRKEDLRIWAKKCEQWIEGGMK